MLRNKFLILSVLTVLAISGLASTSFATTSYPSTFTVNFNWTGCNGYKYGTTMGNYPAQLVVTIAPPPTKQVWMSWVFPKTTSEGAFDDCVNVNFGSLIVAVADPAQGWIGTLLNSENVPVHSQLYTPIVGGPEIMYGDSISVGARIYYGIWSMAVSFTCLNVGNLYGNCTPGGPNYKGS